MFKREGFPLLLLLRISYSIKTVSTANFALQIPLILGFFKSLLTIPTQPPELKLKQICIVNMSFGAYFE